MSTLAELLGRTCASIQKIDVAANTSTQTITIAPVNLNKSIVFAAQRASMDTRTDYADKLSYINATLDSATTISVYKNGYYTTNVTITVVDFGVLCKSVQRGTASNSTPITIATINPSKSFVLVAAGPQVNTVNAKYELTSNTLKITAPPNTYWNLVEFY